MTSTEYQGIEFNIVAQLSSFIDEQPSSNFYVVNINSGLVGLNQSSDFITPYKKKVYYRMRGYYVNGNTYETFISENNPNISPENGHYLIDVVVTDIYR